MSDNTRAFDQLVSTMRSDLGRSLGLRSVDSDLEHQMFESTPGDPQARRLAQEKETQSQDDQRDARSLRLELPDQSNGRAPVGAVVESAAHTQRGKAVPSFGQGAARPAQTVPRTIDDLATSRAGQTPSDITSRSGTARTPSGQPVNGTLGSAADGSAAVSGTKVVAPTVSAASGGEAAGTRGGTARQIAQVLQTGSDAPASRAAAAAPANGRSPQGDRNTGQDMQRQASTRESQSSPSSRDTGRAIEPTPFDDLVRSIRLNTQSKFSTARIRLDPPELGHMRIDVELNGSQLTLRVRTETNEAARRVQSRVNELKAALERHGIQVDSVDVRIDADRSGASSALSYEMDQETQDSTRQDPTTMRQDGHHDTDEGHDGAHGAWDEIDVGRFWGGAEWFGTARGRVDVRV